MIQSKQVQGLLLVAFLLALLGSCAARLAFSLSASPGYKAEWVDGLFGALVGVSILLGMANLTWGSYVRAKRSQSFYAVMSFSLVVVVSLLVGVVGVMTIANGLGRLIASFP